MVDLMNLEDQVDLDFTVARRWARLGQLKELLLGRGTGDTLLSPDELRRGVPASGSTYRGRRTLEVKRIVGIPKQSGCCPVAAQLLHRCCGLHPYMVREDRHSPSLLEAPYASFVSGNFYGGRCLPQRAKRLRTRIAYPTARNARVTVKMRRL